MVNQAIVATRQYAKRQLTWFRRETDINWYDAEDSQKLGRTVLADLLPLYGPEGVR